MVESVNIRLGMMWLCAALSSHAADWYASTNGTGDGSISSPWSLSNAFASVTIQAGDTVWLRGGTYAPGWGSTNHALASYLNYYPGWFIASGGSGTNRITFRSFAGEWAVIDGRVLTQDSICFRDLEFLNSLKGVRNTNVWDDFNAVYPHFIHNAATNLLWVNCLIHDIDDGGFANQSNGGNALRGCILWYIGWDYREHVFYPMVDSLSGSIVMWPLNRTVNNSLADFVCNSNIIYGSGKQWVSGGPIRGGEIGEKDTDISPSGHKVTMVGNVVVSSVDSITGTIAPGSVISNNIFYAQQTPVTWGASSNATFVRNTLYDADLNGVVVVWSGQTPGLNTVDFNNYYVPTNAAGACFIDFAVQEKVPLSTWRSTYGFDINSTTNYGNPPDTVRIFPNSDEAKRCHIAVCNWTLADNVEADLSGVLSVGDTYNLFSVQNYSAGAIKTGVYTGPITIPMTNLTAIPLVYGTNINAQNEVVATPSPSSPAFGAFVLMGSAPTANRYTHTHGSGTLGSSTR